MAACRKDAAWKFSTRTDLATFEARVRSELESSLARTRAKLAEIESILESWAERPKRRRVHHRRHTAWDIPF
jgi:hypothetical protein